MNPRQRALIGLTLVAAGTAPWLRSWLEADMARHMLLQFPLLVLAGTALASSLPPRVRAACATINAHGLAGLLLCLLVHLRCDRIYRFGQGVHLLPDGLKVVALERLLEVGDRALDLLALRGVDRLLCVL